MTCLSPKLVDYFVNKLKTIRVKREYELEISLLNGVTQFWVMIFGICFIVSLPEQVIQKI